MDEGEAGYTRMCVSARVFALCTTDARLPECQIIDWLS